MRFAPQRRALFRRLNFQKCSERLLFGASDLQVRLYDFTWHVQHFVPWALLRATAACTFSTTCKKRSGVEICWKALILTLTCASRHICVRFLSNTASKSVPFWATQLSKASRTWGACHSLASTCALRHSHVRFLSNTAPKVLRRWNSFHISHVEIEMCFPPQLIAFFEQQLPKAPRCWSAFHMLASTCASRYSRVHFLSNATSKSAPNMRCF